MTVKRARLVFAVLMQAAREHKHLTAYDKQQLNIARQVLRQSRKPIMNASGPFTDAKRFLSSIGISIIKTDYGEYRVNFKRGNEATAYYTDDLQDAVGTGKQMIKRGKYHTRSTWIKDVVDDTQSNPKHVLIYGEIHRVTGVKTQKHICDADCKRHGHKYYHDFSSKPQMYGLPDGSLLIKSKR